MAAYSGKNYFICIIPTLFFAQQQSFQDFCATGDTVTNNTAYSFSAEIEDLYAFPNRTFNVYFWDIQTDEGGEVNQDYIIIDLSSYITGIYSFFNTG